MEKPFHSRAQLLDFLSKHNWGYAQTQWRYILIYDNPKIIGWNKEDHISRNSSRPSTIRGYRLDTPTKVQIFLDRFTFEDLKGAIYIHTPLDSYLGF
jgi:hypothetical protein